MQSLFYYHKPGIPPFRNLMDLSDQAIVEFMTANLPEDAVFHANPEKYIKRRRETETWLYREFRGKGGKPKTTRPIYMTLGSSSYIESIGIYTARQEFPLDLFPESVISFTYPDSYISRLLSQKRDEHFNAKVHGQVFTKSELGRLLEDSSIHNEAWKNDQRRFDIFIEAQIWDIAPMLNEQS